jgi:hypothetical protein
MPHPFKNLPVKVDTASLLNRVRVQPDSDDAGLVQQLVNRALAEANPKILYGESFIDTRTENTITIDGVTFTSRALAANLSTVERVFPFVATCGRELDQIAPKRDDFLQTFWWDAIKTMVLECSLQWFHAHLREKFLLKKFSTMNPGSGDADLWPITQQKELFTLLGAVYRQIGVELTDSFLMTPNKSVSGIVFPLETDFTSCQVCHRQACPNRRAPFDPEHWQALGH